MRLSLATAGNLKQSIDGLQTLDVVRLIAARPPPLLLHQAVQPTPRDMLLLRIAGHAIGRLLRRSVRQPTGACDRVSIDTNPRPSFAATNGEVSFANLEAVPPLSMPKVGGYVTIWQGGRIVWKGNEEAISAYFLQEDFDL